MSDLLNAKDLITINRVVGESGKLVKPDILESAFASVEYYEDFYQKIASVGRSVMQGHPFVDGNKRTGILFMLSVAKAAGMPVSLKTDDEIVEFATLSVVERWSVEKIAHWLEHG